MKLFCPNCGRTIAEDDVDLVTSSAKCSRCRTEFNFLSRSRVRAAEQNAVQPQATELIPRPPRMRVERAAQYTTISWRWFKLTYIFLTFFCIAWDSFLIFWYSMAFSGHAPWLMVVFPIAHVAVGVGLTYTCLCGFLNHTRVALARNELRITHGPLPWWPNRSIAAGQIKQLFCERRATENSRNGSQISYSLNVIFRNGSQQKLLSMDSLGEAKFLERSIEDYYHIAQQPVAGEA